MPKAILIFALCSVASGCSMVKSGCRTLITEPVAYCFHKDEHRSRVESRRLAAAAWDRVKASSPEALSAHYERGFFDGFSEYVLYNGTGNPPPLPPRDYWNLKFQNPAG